MVFELAIKYLVAQSDTGGHDGGGLGGSDGGGGCGGAGAIGYTRIESKNVHLSRNAIANVFRPARSVTSRPIHASKPLVSPTPKARHGKLG